MEYVWFLELSAAAVNLDTKTKDASVTGDDVEIGLKCACVRAWESVCPSPALLQNGMLYLQALPWHRSWWSWLPQPKKNWSVSIYRRLYRPRVSVGPIKVTLIMTSVSHHGRSKQTAISLTCQSLRILLCLHVVTAWNPVLCSPFSWSKTHKRFNRTLLI